MAKIAARPLLWLISPYTKPRPSGPAMVMEDAVKRQPRAFIRGPSRIDPSAALPDWPGLSLSAGSTAVPATLPGVGWGALGLDRLAGGEFWSGSRIITPAFLACPHSRWLPCPALLPGSPPVSDDDQSRREPDFVPESLLNPSDLFGALVDSAAWPYLRMGLHGSFFVVAFFLLKRI